MDEFEKILGAFELAAVKYGCKDGDDLAELRGMNDARANVVAHVARLQADAERYAQVRTWTPVVFANAWEVNLKTGKPFDEIVDHLKPFREKGA